MSVGERTRLTLRAFPAIALGLLAGVKLLATGSPGLGAGVHLGILAAATPSAWDASTAAASDVPLSLVAVGSGLLVAIAFTAGYFVLPRGGVDEVFLVHDSGLLLVHFSKTLKPEKDRDVLVGMLTAVQSFVKDAFSKASATNLKEMDFGDRRLLICKGAYGYLAVLIQGRTPLGMARRMRLALAEVEAKYRAAIASWDGSSDALSGADDLLIAGLLTGWLKRFQKTVVAMLRWTRTRLAARQRPAPPAAKPAAARGIQVDPRETARALLRRPELQSFRPEYRDMMATALQQIEEGRFSLTGLANIYMVMALQKNPRPNVVGWWNLVLRTVRDVLWTWPWTPRSQSWVLDESAMPVLPPDANPSPIKAPVKITAEPSLAPPLSAVAAARRAANAEPADSA
ncbi:MAG TPA: hypothetical protein VEY12_12905 [Thermoplasmata archaeon]|nr:hypothetical protein [Thermoplasmata archaeon]